MSILRNTLNQSGFKILACTFLALSLTACGGTDSDKTEKPNDIIPPSLEVPVSPEAPTDPVTPTDPDATPVLTGEWSEAAVLDTKIFGAKFNSPSHPIKSLADDNGNIFYVWGGGSKGLWAARNTSAGWAEPVKLAPFSREDYFSWVVTPKGDAFVFWQEGARQTNQLALKLAHYSVETNSWSEPVVVTSYDDTYKPFKSELLEREEKIEQLEDIFINIDANGDILLTWAQVSRVSRKDIKDNKPKTIQYTFTELVNRTYVLNSGLDVPKVFWSSLSQTEDSLAAANTSEKTLLTTFDAGRIENVTVSPHKVFVVAHVSHILSSSSKQHSFNTITCNGSSCTEENASFKKLRVFDSGKIAALNVNLSTNKNDQAFVSFYNSTNHWGVLYNPDSGWGTLEGLQLKQVSSFAASPVSIINEAGKGLNVWNGVDPVGAYANFFDGAWQEENTQLYGENISNYVHLSLSPGDTPYAMWQVREPSLNEEGGLVHDDSFIIKAYIDGSGWIELPEIKSISKDSSSVIPYQLTYDKQGNLIAVWNSFDSYNGTLRVSRFKPD